MVCYTAAGKRGLKIYDIFPTLQCLGHFQCLEMLSTAEEGALKGSQCSSQHLLNILLIFKQQICQQINWHCHFPAVLWVLQTTSSLFLKGSMQHLNMHAYEIIGILSTLKESRNCYHTVLVLNSHCFLPSLEKC